MDPSSFSSPELENPLQSSTERDATHPDYPFLGLPPLLDNSSVVFVLDKAPLEVAGYGNGCFIVDDDHKTFVRRSNKTLADYRPDLLHQALLAIKDSPIYRAGRVGLYIRTEKGGEILKLKPSSRVPRTYKQFASLMRDSLVP